LHAHRADCGVDQDWEHACKVVMQCAALIAGIGGIMLMLAIVGVEMMMMIVSDTTGCDEIGRNVLLDREDVLEMQADERHYAGRLGKEEEPDQPRSNSSSINVRDHSGKHPTNSYQIDASETRKEHINTSSKRLRGGLLR
jgi:hypothetical protein